MKKGGKYLVSVLTEEYFMENYVKKGMSLMEIAKENGCDYVTVTRHFNKHKLEKFKLAEILGKKFGTFTATSVHHVAASGLHFFNVECECGREKVLKGLDLIRDSQNLCMCSNPKSRCYGCGELSLHYFSSLKRWAKMRDLNFDVTIEYLWDLFQSQVGKCALSGIPIILDRKSSQKVGGKHEKKIRTASLDRINSNEGYFEGNVQWAHRDANHMKWDSPENEFFEWCKKVVDFQNSKPK